MLPPERARRVLLAGAMDAGRNIPDLAPDVILQEIAEGAAVYLVRFHVPNYGQEAGSRDAVAAAVLRALQHVGMTIARPGMDLQLARVSPPVARPRRAALLQRIGLFNAFNADERAMLEQAMTEKALPQGATIVRQGEAGHSLLVLAEGVLDVLVEQDGETLTVDRMVPGDVFGEMSLLTGQARSATVVAATEAVVFEIEKEHLDPLLRQRPELVEGLARMMAQRQARNAERGRAVELAGQPTPAGAEDLLGRLRQFFRLS
jgi:CRP-like cAMP-binding protein